MNVVLNLEACEFSYTEHAQDNVIMSKIKKYKVPILNLDKIDYVLEEQYKKANAIGPQESITMYALYIGNRAMYLTPESYLKVIKEYKNITEKESNSF